MSSSAEFTPTLEYLTDAAHLLQATAPATSAHLMSQRGELMWHHDISISESQRQHVCGACGNIMIPGNSSALKLDARRARHATKKTEPRRAKELTKVIQCGRCDKSTKTKIESVPRSKFAKTKASQDVMKTTAKSDSASQPAKPAAAAAQSNASSKKRAKNRKAGLQALLAGQQQQKSNPLSLADFMKK